MRGPSDPSLLEKVFRMPAPAPALFSRRQLLAWPALGVAGTVVSDLSLAQTAGHWPDKPIRMVVVGPSGGSADILARLIGEGLSRTLGQAVVVDAKPGGLGAIAMDAFMGLPRDGHAFMVGVNSLVTELPHTLKPRYDPFTVIKPLLRLTNGGMVLVSNASLPASNFTELLAYIKERPGRISYASYTPGTASHINGLLLSRLTGLEMQHIGYKGSPPALQDILGGQVTFMFDGLGTSLPLIQSGRLRAYAVVAPKRIPQLPLVPTMAELGFPDISHAAWLCLWSLPEAPAAAQQRVRAEVLRIITQPEVRDRLAAIGLEVPQVAATPEELMVGNQKDHAAVGRLFASIQYRPE
jgi:tripartite-type tricarboxylate transporter receptor subunit TctC